MSSKSVLLRIVLLVGLLVLCALMLADSPLQPQEKKAPEETALIQSLNGQALFQAYCATCHGTDAKGGGPTASSLKTKPPDLTRIAQRNGGQFPSVRVQQIIAGGDSIASHGSRAMPVWGPIFGQIAWDQDLGRVRIHNLAKYLESLQQK